MEHAAVGRFTRLFRHRDDMDNVAVTGCLFAGRCDRSFPRSALATIPLCLIVAASLATAAAVASAGVVGFVGLIAPHISRRLVGNSHAVLIPISGLLGACLMLVADAIARVIVAPAELPVGIITSILGCPFFLTLLVVRSRQGSDR